MATDTAQNSFVEDAEAQAVAAAMRERNPSADPLGRLPDVHPARIPRHVAIIMDGNGRWAEERGFPREFGHRNGAASVRAVTSEAGKLGIEAVTLYSFSSENWKRPEREISALMELCIQYCSGEAEHLRRENVRVRVIGRRGELPGEVRAAIDGLEAATAECTGCTLCLAINYGGRAEIVDAARRLAERVHTGELEPGAIDEEAIGASLDTDGLGEVDLLVRTGGDMRVSNFLLWQIAYAEIVVTETLWPDFGEAALRDAVRAFSRRKRRFGGLDRDRGDESSTAPSGA